MTKERIEEMAKAIYNMHGLAEREQQSFFYDGMIYYYDMQQGYIVKNGNIEKAFYVNFKESESKACEIVFKADGTIKSVDSYNDFRNYNKFCQRPQTTLKAPIKRCF